MSFIRKRKKPETKAEDNIFEKMYKELQHQNTELKKINADLTAQNKLLDEQEKVLDDIEACINMLIEKDKQVHDRIDKPAEDDKKEELDKKIEEAQ